MSNTPPFSLDRTILAEPLQSVLPTRVAAALPDEVLTNLGNPLIPNQAAVTQHPLFTNLDPARQYQPGFAARAFLRDRAPAFDRNYQRNLTALENKYNELEPFIESLSPSTRNALIGLDTRRVSQGTSPLTREATIKAAAAAETNTQVTETPERGGGLLGIFGNIRSDLSDILKSIPRLPAGIAHEILDIPNIGARMAEAREEGMNPLSALLSAPGIRMIPGAYLGANILEGDFGELAAHPLFSALDVLPLANRAAGSTRLARETQLAREAQVRALSGSLGRELPAPQPRPISAVLTNRLGAGGVERNMLGRSLDRLREETPFGQRLESAFGSRARTIAREQGLFEQRLKMFMVGEGTPRGASLPQESLVREVAPLFRKWESQYPFLTTKPNLTPKVAKAFREQRAKFYEDLTGPNPAASIDPVFLREYDDLIEREALLRYSEDKLGRFDNEWYPVDVANKLTKSSERADFSRRMVEFRNEYLNPSGTLTLDQFRRMADDVRSLPSRYRMDGAHALESTLDAYGIEIKPLKGRRAALNRGGGDWDAWYDEIDAVLSDPATVIKPRASMDTIIQTLRAISRTDPQAKALEVALRANDVFQVTRALDNIYSRKTPPLPPELRADIRSMSHRRKFDQRKGARYSRLLTRHMNAVQALRSSQAPARFGPLLSRQAYGYVDPVTGQLTPGRIARKLRGEAELSIGKRLTPEEAGALARDVYDQVWTKLPGLDPQFASDYAATVAKEVTQSWRRLRAAGFDPKFVHKVTPHRAQEQLTGKIGPVPTDETHLAERAIDLTPDAMRDVQVALTHQMAESLSRQYSEQFIHNVIQIVGKSEADLQNYYLAEARRTAATDPTMTSRGWLQKLTRDSYRRFNPEEAGFSWGGARFTKYYNENAFYIPTAIYDNLKRYAKRPSIFSTVTDPLTKTFRYNVIGLSPSIIINNFFSNSVAMTAERGLRPWKHFRAAWEWAKNPLNAANIPDELRAAMLAEIPHMEHLGMDAYLSSRTGQKFMGGFNSGRGFMESAAADAIRRGKSAMDGVVQKSMQLQRMGDNIYRAMIYMDAMERQALKGTALKTAEAAAMDLVSRTLVDYKSFTPIERNAIRSLIPFYSYMGHAARFIMRYPLNHPMRAQIISHIAMFERERLGALPGSFLSFFPIGSIDQMGKMNFFALRPFDPFGDQADLLTIAGWVAAMNPAAQIALRQIGVTRGEAEIYPTLRYDPETGRMRAVRPNPITDLIMTAVPRAGLVTSLLGLNPDYNELRARDQAAADRSLLAQAGIPRLWRNFNIPQEIIRAELSRQQVESDVLNEAMRSGDWTEALRYPNLRAYYDQIGALTPEQLAAMTPASPDALAGVVNNDILGR